MLTPQSPNHLRAEAKAHLAEYEKLRNRADAVLTSGAPRTYSDVLDLYEEVSANAEAEFHLAMKLYRAAHATEHSEREHTTRAA